MTHGPCKLGRRFGPYVLEAYLGSDADKSVYRARRVTDGEEPRPRANAALRPSTLDTRSPFVLCFPHVQEEKRFRQFEPEFAVLRQLNHPNIARTYALEHLAGVTFWVREYVEGESLRARLDRMGALPQDQALRIAGLVSEALAYAHAARTLHRDVRPENVHFTADDCPKMLDFGLARYFADPDPQASRPITAADYLAPEATQGAVGANADLWALGVTLHEMLTGHRPFARQVGEPIQSRKTACLDEQPLLDRGVDRSVVRILRKMLQPDPESRYRTAEELVLALATVARQARLLDEDEDRLELLIRACIPLIYILSFEEERVLAAVHSIAKRLSQQRHRPRRLYVWSTSRGLRDEQDHLVRPDSTDDPTAALDHVIENAEDALYVFLDIHRHYSPVTTRLIRDAARVVRSTRKSLLFLSPFFQAPEELQKEMTLSVFQLPDRSLLNQALEVVAAEGRRAGLPVELPDEEREAVLRAAMGLTAKEATLAFRTALVHAGGLFGHSTSSLDTRQANLATHDSSPALPLSLPLPAARLVTEVKAQLIRKTGILEYDDRPGSFADVGGLGRLLEWFGHRAPAFSATARYAGLPLPKGVLLMGVPGCGKSLTARALAGAWGVPLLRLDVGRLFGGYIGQSEANLRLAIQTAEAVSPCILWIDEVEKGFAGVQSDAGGGVAARVFGTFLNWLQDKRSPVFVVATANDLSSLPPEFLRQGRFDDTFFVGLPAEAERKAILRIHLRKRKRTPATFHLDPLAKATEGYSGAELEQVINAALFSAFAADRELTQTDLENAIADTQPLSRSRKEEIAALTAWAENNVKLAG